VVQAGNPSYLRGTDQEDLGFRTNWVRKFPRVCLNIKSWPWWYVPIIPAVIRSINSRIMVYANLGKNKSQIQQEQKVLEVWLTQ
jgi:hypothetical protein